MRREQVEEAEEGDNFLTHALNHPSLAPPTYAQVAAQQGAYMAHVVNRGYVIGRGGMDQPAPSRPLPKGPLGLPALPLPGSNPYDGASYAELAAAVSEPDANVAPCRQTFGG